MMAVDLFAGAGGASDGLAAAGLSPVGFEWDADACASHHLAGHRTVRCDLTRGVPVHGPVRFVWASPPCTAFSVAGKMHGHEVMDDLLESVTRRGWHHGPEIHDDPNVWLALVAMGEVDRLRPEMLAFEQVPGVLPLWQAFGDVLDSWGYSWWAGVLNAADYGVPQTRRRAILMASRVGQAHPPAATHAKDPTPGLFGTLRPWVTMAEALGWDGVDIPSPTVTAGGSDSGGYEPFPPTRRAMLLDRRQQFGGVPTRLVDCATEPAPTLTGIAGEKGQWLLREKRGGERTLDEPALTVTSSHGNGNLHWAYDRLATTIVNDTRVWPPGHKVNADERYGDRAGTDAIRITIRDALILQGFDPDRPLHGSKTSRFRQVGNAVPPPVAAAVARALLGVA